MYRVFGDYGFSSEQELECFYNLEEAVRWAKGYAKHGAGGYFEISVLKVLGDKKVELEHIIFDERNVDEPHEQDLWYDTSAEVV